MHNMSSKSVNNLSKALLSEYIEYLEADPDFYDLHIRKMEEFFINVGMKIDDDLECDIMQSMMENLTFSPVSAS
jgi:hypothetical protein